MGGKIKIYRKFESWSPGLYRKLNLALRAKLTCFDDLLGIWQGSIFAISPRLSDVFFSVLTSRRSRNWLSALRVP